MARLTVQPAGVTLALRPDETILAGLYRAGYAYRIGCRRGGCGICAAQVTAGQVEHHGGVGPPVEDGSCLTCRAVPLTDVVIRLAGDARLRRVMPMLAGLAGATESAGATGAEPTP